MDKTAEQLFEEAWTIWGLSGCRLEREYAFHPNRRWRIDFAILSIGPTDLLGLPKMRVAVEIEGRGRHQSFAGFAKDAEKYNALVAMGWRLFRFPAHVVSRNAEAVVQELCELICGQVPQESVNTN